MKLKTIIFVMALGLFMCSCESNEPIYSCDTNIDAWVKGHINEIHTMTRANWLESDAKYVIPMYRAFKPEQRIAFWHEKFKELKELPWSDKEILHICKAEDFSQTHTYMFFDEKLSDEQLDEIEIFLYNWADQAKIRFNWTDETILSIVACGNKVMDTHGTLMPLKNANSGKILNAESENCNCNVGSLFTCSQNITCENVECTGTSLGCGGFLAWPCNGRCEEP